MHPRRRLHADGDRDRSLGLPGCQGGESHAREQGLREQLRSGNAARNTAARDFGGEQDALACVRGQGGDANLQQLRYVPAQF